MLAFGVKEFVQLIESDPASAPTQSLNVAFKRLSVFAYARELADPGFTIASPLFNIIMTLILGSMFYNLSANTSSFYYRG
ncbi:multidrug resistance protein CDR1 [Trichophyton violaceum]|nr:multidrug resistance protein CDR1 [Trichophyton violaceum]